MPLYSQVTLSQFVTQISSLMDDAESVYWTVPQIQYAVWEALRMPPAGVWPRRSTMRSYSAPDHGNFVSLRICRSQAPAYDVTQRIARINRKPMAPHGGRVDNRG